MAFTGTEDFSISLSDAAVLTKNYRSAQTTPDFIKGEYFSQKAISDMLNQKDCVGIRMYHAIKTDDAGNNIPCLVLCGVTANGNDITDGNACLAENGMICPPACSEDNPLNSDM